MKNFFMNLFLISALMLLLSFSTFAAKTLSGTYKYVVNGYDWGPAVNKIIVSLDSTISEIDAEDLIITETKKWYSKNDSDTFPRTIENAYLSDENGNITNKKSKYFSVELYVSPYEGSPFLFDVQKFLNKWTDPYFLTIKSKSDKLNIDTKPSAKVMPQVESFEMNKYTDDKITLEYAYYSPKKDSKKNPLVIWLHGMGEGGKDPSLLLLGNEVTMLTSYETQAMFKGAYVLAPQAPTFWMDNGSGDINDFNGTSMYDKVLISLIKNFVASHPDIDKNRIIVGGCSNGGYMTMRLLVNNPDYFAAAYPICEAYFDNLLSDEMIEDLKNIPIWFTHSASDQIADPIAGTVKTYRRLLLAGAENVHLSLFGNIMDTNGYKTPEGKTYQYNSHFSWVYALNNQCKDPVTGEILFEWAARQTKKDL